MYGPSPGGRCLRREMTDPAPEADSAAGEPVWLGETRADGRRCEGCRDWDTQTFAVRVTGGPGDPFFQTFTLEDPGLMASGGQAHWEDVNFDGISDVLIFLGGANGGTARHAALLWDGAAGAYREEPSFAEIVQPVPDPDRRIIWDGFDASYGFGVYAWEYREGTFVRTHGLEAAHLEDAYWEQGIVYTEYAVDDTGEWAEVNRLEISERGAGWDRVEEYLEAGPVWRDGPGAMFSVFCGRADRPFGAGQNGRRVV